MRKKLFVFISLLCLPLMLLFPACKGDDITVEQREPAKPVITLNITEVNLYPGGKFYVIPKGASDSTMQLVYSSSDATIAAVEQDGLITAKKLGTTSIVVTYGESTATCTVNVVPESYVPTVHLDYLATDEISVSLLDSVNLSSHVMYNGVRYEDATYTYKFSDDTVAKVEDGLLKPTKVGETTLTIQASWGGYNGVSLEKNLKINVINAFEFYVNNGETIYSIHNRENVGADVYGKTEIAFNIHCLENNVAVENVVVTVVEGADIIRYDETDSKLKVVNEKTGNAKVTVTATDSNGEEHVLSFKIKVYESGPSTDNENGGYFNPDWVFDQVDDGKFNPDWIKDQIDDENFNPDWVEEQA